MAKRIPCGRCGKPPARGVGYIECAGIRICLPCVKDKAAKIETDKEFEKEFDGDRRCFWKDEDEV